MGKSRAKQKQVPLNRSKPGLPEVSLDEIDEIVEAVAAEPPPSPSDPAITVNHLQNVIIQRIQANLVATQAHRDGLVRRLERLAFTRQKAVNQDAVRYVANRLNEQLARTESRLADLQAELAKELRLQRCRAEIKELEDDMQRHRTMNSLMEDRLRQLQQELNASTGIEHEQPIRLHMKDQRPAAETTQRAMQTEPTTAAAV